MPPNAPQPQPPNPPYKAPYNPPPPPPQPKSNLESLLEHFIATQIKTNEVLSESINQLNAKFDAMASHQKGMDNQIAQVAQQVSHLSRPQGHLPSQPRTNPKGYVNAISVVDEEFGESPVMVLQEVTTAPSSVGAGGGKKEAESLSSTEKPSPSPPIRPYQPLVPYP